MDNSENKISYSKMQEFEFESFKEMFSVFQDLILSMVRNAVHVLPIEKLNAPSLKAHMRIKSLSKNVEYCKFVDVKEVFLSCIENVYRRQFLDKITKGFTIDDNKKIRFVILQSIYSLLSESEKKYFTKDIKRFEEIINNINDNFNQRLPEAKQQGKLMISKIRRLDVPNTAKYQGRQTTKQKGREV